MKHRYAVILEKGNSSYGAYVPDLPGCVAVGETSEEVKQLIEEAIELHLEALLLQGERVLPPVSGCFSCEVDLTRIKQAVRNARPAVAANGTSERRGKQK